MPCSRTCCREELRAHNFLLQFSDPCRFTRFEWGCPAGYLLWRAFGCLFSVGLVVNSVTLNVIYYNLTVKWPIFLTHWAMVALLAYSVWDMAASIYVYTKRKDILTGWSHSMPWYLRLTWVLYNVSHAMAIMVSCLYWAVLYKSGQTFEGRKCLPLLAHGTNSIYVLLNIIMSGIPTRVYHFFHTIIVGVLYAIFTYVYHVMGGTDYKNKPYIYEILDWSVPGRTSLILVGSLFGALVVHVIIYFLYLLRKSLFHLCTCCATCKEHSSTDDLRAQPYEMEKLTKA